MPITQRFVHKDMGRSLPSAGSQIIPQPSGAEMVLLASEWSGRVQSDLRTSLKGDMGREVAGGGTSSFIQSLEASMLARIARSQDPREASPAR